MFGPFNTVETRSFLSSVVRGHKDTHNLRYDLHSAALELAGTSFDEAMMWTVLDEAQLAKKG